MAKYTKVNITSEEYRKILGEKINRIRKIADVEPEILTETIIEGQEIDIEEVRPGEIITSDLFNKIIRKLNALELQASAFDDLIKLGPLAEDTHTLLVLSGSSSEEEGLWIDGVHRVSNLEPGLNLIILDENLEVVLYEKNPSDSKYKQILSEIKEGQLLILVTMTNTAEKNVKSGSKANMVLSPSGILKDFVSIDSNNCIIVSRIVKAPFTSKILLSVSNSIETPLSIWGIYSIPHDRFLIGGTTGNDLVDKRKPAEDIK